MIKLKVKNLDSGKEQTVNVHAIELGKRSAKVRKEKYGHDSNYYKKLSDKAQEKKTPKFIYSPHPYQSPSSQCIGCGMGELTHSWKCVTCGTVGNGEANHTC